MSTFKVKFTGFKEVGDHIEYSITLTHALSGQNFDFSHRYSILRHIFLSLVPSPPGIEFPRKKLFGNRSKNFLSQRKLKLESCFATVFSKEEYCKALTCSSYFKVKLEETGTKIISQPSIVSVCEACTKTKCWELSHTTVDRFIDISCHPGILNESEIIDSEIGLTEKCKDFKILIKSTLPSPLSINYLEERVGNNKWMLNAFSNCINSLEIKLIT